MASGPDRLEIHVYGAPGAPPQRRGPSLGVLILCFVFWPVLLFGWLAWFGLTLLLTFAGLVIAAGGLVLWLAGRLIAVRWPDAGGGVMAAGRGVAQGTVHAVDVMNGHARKSLPRRRA